MRKDEDKLTIRKTCVVGYYYQTSLFDFSIVIALNLFSESSVIIVYFGRKSSVSCLLTFLSFNNQIEYSKLFDIVLRQKVLFLKHKTWRISPIRNFLIEKKHDKMRLKA